MPSRWSPCLLNFFLFLLARWGDAFSVGTTAVCLQTSSVSTSDDCVDESVLSHFTILSKEPLVFVTETPLLSEKECHILKDGLRDGTTPAPADEHSSAVLKSLQNRLDRLLLRGDEAAVVVPRFLDYPAEDALVSNQVTPEQLLPDGLHVDTNNAFYFRYLTVLVYLSTSDRFGATTFPVVKTSNEENDSTYSRAAHDLLDLHDQHHTRPPTTESSTSVKEATAAAQVLEDAALQLFLDDSSSNNKSGLRILPRTGHALVFSSLLANGHPDPRTWHGAEHVFADEKQALSFFYECPNVTSRQELGAYAAKRYATLLGRYHEKAHSGAANKGKGQKTTVLGVGQK